MTATKNKQPRANQPTGLPRREEEKAAAAAAKMLSGLELQPGKLVVDLFIDFNDCKQFAQMTQKVNPDIKIESGVKIGDVPALVDTGANVVAPVLVGLAFLKRVLPTHCVEQFLSNVRQNVSGADGKDNLSIVGKLSVLIGFRPENRDTAPFLLKVDAALMEPLAGEVIVSGELLLQNGAAIYYPIPGVREAYIRLDRLGRQRYPWFSTSQLSELHRRLRTGKTVTWFTSDNQQQVTAITYPIAREGPTPEEVVTCADTELYPGEAREVAVQPWQGLASEAVC